MTAGPDRPGRAAARAAAGSALLYSLLMAAPLLWGVFKGDGASVFGALIAATWSASPAYGAALFARASATEGGAVLFLAAALAALCGWRARENWPDPPAE